MYRYPRMSSFHQATERLKSPSIKEDIGKQTEQGLMQHLELHVFYEGIN